MLAVRLAARGSSDTHAQRALLPAAVSVVAADVDDRASPHGPGYTDRQQVADVENRFFAFFDDD